MSSVPLLEVSDIECRHQNHAVVKGLTMHLERETIACLLGPSGCGKTTVLRAIAGFEPLHGGTIAIDGRIVSSPQRRVPPEQRRIGMVSQDYALFPHLSVEDNIAFGLRRATRGEKRARVSRLLDLVGLQEAQRRYPHELSGGQQQRVALARALAVGPELLLLDEPFSSLDVELRERLGAEMCAILKEKRITTLMVTHDQHEAFALSEAVGIMSAGELVQWDTPFNLYHQPVNRFVAGFIGHGVLLRGTLLDARTARTALGTIRSERRYDWPAGSGIEVLVRPDDIVPDADGPLRGLIVREAFKGAEILYTLRLEDGTEVLSLFPSHNRHQMGEEVGLSLAVDHLVAFRSDQGT